MWVPEREHRKEAYSASAFLFSVWTELFDPLTPDTYQPRLHNVASLVEELGDISARVESASIWWKHIHVVREELARASDEEQDLLRELPEYSWQVERIIKADTAREIQLTCRLMCQRRAEYERHLHTSIRSCANGLPKEKEAAFRSLRRLATLAVQGSKDIPEVLPIKVQVTDSAAQVVTSLMDATIHDTQQYECVFPVIGTQSDVQRTVRSSGFQLVREGLLPAAEVELLRNAHRSVYFISNTYEGKASRDALAKARDSLSVAVDVYNLYTNAATLRIEDPEGVAGILECKIPLHPGFA